MQPITLTDHNKEVFTASYIIIAFSAVCLRHLWDHASSGRRATPTTCRCPSTSRSTCCPTSCHLASSASAASPSTAATHISTTEFHIHAPTAHTDLNDLVLTWLAVMQDHNSIIGTTAFILTTKSMIHSHWHRLYTVSTLPGFTLPATLREMNNNNTNKWWWKAWNNCSLPADSLPK